MNFDELHDLIPYAKGGKAKVLRMSPYPNITLAMPGRHWEDTTPKGGDFVVMVTDEVFDIPDHQFDHNDIFKDIEVRYSSPYDADTALIGDYLEVIRGREPEYFDGAYGISIDGVMNRMTFLYAIQCLSVAERRRYAQFEPKWGGRYLPFRFAAGIAQGLWTAADAANMQKKGRPGVEILEKKYGLPKLTKELMNG